jgi:hypothetical protein
MLFTPWTNSRRDLERACERAEIAKVLAERPEANVRHVVARRRRNPDLIAPLMGHRDTRMVERVYGRPLDALADRRSVAAAKLLRK